MRASDNFSLIAPCGMNCGICLAYQREKNKCPGCRGSDLHKPVTRSQCKIKNCPTFKNPRLKFCFTCRPFPCDRLKHLDKRYRTNYKMSMIENLEHINKLGIKKFVAEEKSRWACSECGGMVCVHRGYCLVCGNKTNETSSFEIPEFKSKGRNSE